MVLYKKSAVAERTRKPCAKPGGTHSWRWFSALSSTPAHWPRVGDDFREGKITLPVVLSYRRGTDVDRTFWKQVLEEGKIAEGDLERAVALMRSHRAIDDTVERARHFGAVARDALAPFPESPHKAALLEAVDFCIARVS